MYTVQLTFFKGTGKYYSHGEYETELESLSDIWKEVDERIRNNDTPGVGHPSTFIVLVNVPGHPHEHPRLLNVRPAVAAWME